MSAANEINVGEETPLHQPVKDISIPSVDEIALVERRSDESTRANEAESTTGFPEAESFNSSNSVTPVSSVPVALPPTSSFGRCIGRL